MKGLHPRPAVRAWLNLTAAVLFVLACTVAPASADDIDIIFLHHSTGAGVYNEGDVPGWFSDYNAAYGTDYRITERSFPDSPYDWANYPYDYWYLWVDGACDASSSGIECLDTLAAAYDVIVFKHCFPGAGIEPDSGSPDVASATKTIENYTLQYRALRDLMDSYPDTLFILWTLAPLHRLATSADQAARAHAFVDWVTTDFQREDGRMHPNIALFDFWAIVAEDDPAPSRGKVNCLRYDYEQNHLSSDSHPNPAANQAAGPAFAQMIVDAAGSFFGTGTVPVDDDNGSDSGDGEDDSDTSPCAATLLLGPGDPRIDTLRDLRDRVLSRSTAGKHLIMCYDENTAALTALLEQNPRLRTAARRVLLALLPASGYQSSVLR